MSQSLTPMPASRSVPAYTFIHDVILPIPPLDVQSGFEMDVYVRFMRHLREVPTTRVEIKILQAIQFTATMMRENEAFIAKLLVDMGLRAPKRAFPQGFIYFVVVQAAASTAFDYDTLSPALAMQQHWGSGQTHQRTAMHQSVKRLQYRLEEIRERAVRAQDEHSQQSRPRPPAISCKQNAVSYNVFLQENHTV